MKNKLFLNHSIPICVCSTDRVNFIEQKKEIRKDKIIINECTVVLPIGTLKNGLPLLCYSYYGEERVTKERFQIWKLEENILLKKV